MENVTASQLLDAAVEILDGTFKKSEARAVTQAVVQAVQEELAEGNAVNLFQLVKLTPSGLPKRKVQGFKEFGNPASGMVTKTKNAELKLKAKPLKAAKDGLPTPNSSAGKKLIAEGQKRLDAAAKRKKQREREARS